MRLLRIGKRSGYPSCWVMKVFEKVLETSLQKVGKEILFLRDIDESL